MRVTIVSDISLLDYATAWCLWFGYSEKADERIEEGVWVKRRFNLALASELQQG